MDRVTIKAALKSLTKLKKHLETALASLDADALKHGVEPNSLKRADGRLTEAGAGAVDRMLDEGRTPAQIAKAMDITGPAVLQRRNRYLAQKGRG